jgi:hypothetical protein
LHHDARRHRRFFSRIEVVQSHPSFDPPNGGAPQWLEGGCEGVAG